MAIARTTQAVQVNTNSSLAQVSVTVTETTQVIVALGTKKGQADGSVTINSSAMTAVSSGSMVPGTSMAAILGYLFPATTGAIVVQSQGGNNTMITGVAAAVYSGVDTTTPIVSSAVSTAFSSNAIVTLSSGDLKVAGAWLSTGAGAPSPTTIANMTNIVSPTTGGNDWTLAFGETTAASVGWSMAAARSEITVGLGLAATPPTTATTAGGGPSFTVSIWG